MIKKILKWSAVFILVVGSVYLLGPRVRFPKVDTKPISFDIPLESLDAYVEDKEDEVLDLKPDNEARIIWADSIKSKTQFSVVYLHGFSASQEEGDPIHTEFAKRYGFNLYLSRLYDHGRKSEDTFKNLTPQDLVNSAKEAIAIGKLLGDQVILMSCSTGGTLSAILAPDDPAIQSMIMYSPNIDLFDTSSDLMLKPWGRQMLKLVIGDEYLKVNYNESAKKYWSEVYHTDGLLALKFLINERMNEKAFSKVDTPLYLGYYYKDEDHQDDVVSVSRMIDFYNQVNTPEEMKRQDAFPEAGRHVLSSYIFSKDLENVKQKTYLFAEEVLKFKPIM